MMERRIRNSAKALIIRDGRIAVIRIRDNDEEWYILPGGGQESGEMLSEAVQREVAEELGLEVTPRELVFAVEGVQGESFHRVDLVFLCEYVHAIENAALHADINQAGIEWLEIASLNTSKLYPSKLRRQIMNLYEGKPHKTYLGNESVGDPEVLD